MIKLSKTTDYGIVLLAQLAGAEAGRSLNARELAAGSDLPVPMVSKVLKALAREGLLVSQRGAKGGYSLARPPEELPVADVIRVLEGPLGKLGGLGGRVGIRGHGGCSPRGWVQGNERKSPRDGVPGP